MRNYLKFLFFLSGCIFSCHSVALSQKRILLIVAMDTEAIPIIKKFHLKHSSVNFLPLPTQIYEGKTAKNKIFLLINGVDPMFNVQSIDTQAATLTTYVGIKHFKPDLVISVGTAAGLASQGAHVGDIYASKTIYFYARRLPDPYHNYGAGGYPSFALPSFELKTATVCSGDSFDEEITDNKNFLQLGCVVRENEAAAVAWVSILMHTPMIAIKGITDLIGDPKGYQQFDKNFGFVTDKLATTLVALL